MRIAIVNDVKMVVELLRRIIAGIPGCEIAWTAADGVEAVNKCADDTPDLVVMDLFMPRMNGVEATRQIMKASPCAILIVTATVEGNSSNVFDALGEGALDAVNTPEDNPGGEYAFVRKISMLKKLIGTNMAYTRRTVRDSDRLYTQAATPPLLVAIGASTGGPKAVADLLTAIPPDLNIMFTVIQHIDKQFVKGLALWLKSSCRLEVRIAVPGDTPKRGQILLAGTNDHMIMMPNGHIDYTVAPETNPFRPSVDVFFGSLAEHWNAKGIAVLLTGIGRDGAEGMLKLRRAGWHTIAQNRESCVVYGMPKAAVELNAATEILPPSAIGQKIIELIAKG